MALIHPVLAGALGLEPDAMEGRLRIIPRLPCGGRPASLRGYRVGDARLDAEFHPGAPTRVSVKVLSGHVQVEVTPAPCFDPLAPVKLRPGMRP